MVDRDSFLTKWEEKETKEIKEEIKLLEARLERYARGCLPTQATEEQLDLLYTILDWRGE